MATTATASSGEQRWIVAFKAGRAVRREGTNWVDPQPTKGLISIQAGEDGLLHLYWANRETGTVEEDLILFPGDASFVPVTNVEGGRTYVLKFASSDQRLFFWMQDLDSSQDQDRVNKINSALGDSQLDAEAEQPGAATAMVEPSAGSSMIAPTAHTPSSGTGNQTTPAELARLRALIQSMGARGGTRGGGMGMTDPGLSLSDILTPQNLSSVFSNRALLERDVYPTLPTDLPATYAPSTETLQRIVESPPFQASVRQLDHALATGQLQGLVVGLGLPAEAGMGVGPFLKAITDQAKRKPAAGQGQGSASSGGDNMQTD